MLILNVFSEYGAKGAVSMKDCISDKPYMGIDKIVEYLTNNGKTTVLSTALPKDRITGERIEGELYWKESDGFSWMSDLAYHVKKYNLRLPKDFEDFILNRLPT